METVVGYTSKQHVRVIPGKTILLDNPLVAEPAEKFSSFSANPEGTQQAMCNSS